MEIGRYLVISTAHLRFAGAMLLDRWARLPPAAQPLVVSATACGWFVATPEPADRRDVPDELIPILAYARAHGCALVLFDSDGPEDADLALFPW